MERSRGRHMGDPGSTGSCGTCQRAGCLARCADWRRTFLAALRPDQQQWKFVVRDDTDEQSLRALLLHYPLFAEHQLPIILQPEGDAAIQDYSAALERLAERVRDPFWDDYYVRILPQMHVIIWRR